MGYGRKSPDAPCFGCTERHVGCHGSCPLYGEFRLSLDESSKEYRNSMKTNAVMRGYVSEAGKRYAKMAKNGY